MRDDQRRAADLRRHAPTTCSGRRATCTPRTGSSRWTCAGTSPRGGCPSWSARTTTRCEPTRWSAPWAGGGSPSRSCRCSTPRPAAYLEAYADGVNAYLRGQLAVGAVGRATRCSARGQPAAADRAVDAGRLAGLAQGDGLGPAQQLRDELDARPGVTTVDDRRARSTSSTRPTRTPTTRRSSPAGRRRTAVPARGIGRVTTPRGPNVAGGPGAVPASARARRRRRGRASAARRHPGWPAGGADRQPRRAGSDAAQRRSRRATPSTPCPRCSARGDGIGSNSWVVSGRLHRRPASRCWPTTRTSTTSMPGHLVPGRACTAARSRAHCPFDVAGFGFAGLPGVVIGHNADDRLGPDQPRRRRHRLLPGAGQRRHVGPTAHEARGRRARRRSRWPAATR